MGFYLRKSIRLGPLRFNLSKSGVGVSAGVKGLRVGVGARGGTYVHMGRDGIYYRKRLGSGRRAGVGRPAPTRFMRGDHEALLPIDSGDVSHMRATSSAEWLAELNRCMARHALWPLVLALGATVVGVVLYLHSPGVVFYATLAALCALTLYVAHRDGLAGTAVLHYRLEGGAAARSERVRAAFREIMGCDAVWHIAARGKVGEQKYFANADRLCLRTRVRPRIAAPPAVATNVSTPCLPAGRQTLYFLPDRVLVIDGRAAGAVAYDELQVRVCDARFIERGALPGDARVADHTWRYVNKTGGPDRRFSDNAELPVARYQRLCLSSASGLNEELLISRYGAAEAFALALNGTVSRGEAELSIAE